MRLLVLKTTILGAFLGTSPSQISPRSGNYQYFKSKNSDTVFGIDVSFYQRDIQWEKLQKIKFIFIKATEGISIRDSKFQRNWDSSRKAGILRGAYHFYRPSVDAKRQFDLFKSRVQIDSGDLPPVLDVEINFKASHLRKEVLTWLRLAESHYGTVPIIYCTHLFNQRYFNLPEFKKYPRWIANYSVSDIGQLTQNWSFWQYSHKGEIEGISGYVDLNIFNGPYDSLLNLCRGN